MPYCLECRRLCSEGEDNCDICGKPSVDVPVLRRGDSFVVHRGAVLPPLCVKCGAPPAEQRLQKFYWHQPVVYLAILLGFLPYVILALALRKQLDLEVPLCGVHVARRRRLYWTGGAILVGGPALCVLMLMSNIESVAVAGCVTSCVAFLAGLLCLAAAPRTVHPTEITDEHGVFKGACPAFLEVLA